MNNEKQITIHLNETSNLLSESLQKGFIIGNSMWSSTIRLIITLSSSFLLITLALVKDIFGNIHPLPLLLIIGWIGYFCTIICGIFAEINEIIFHQNENRTNSTLAQEIRQKISEGHEHAFIKNDSHVNNSIYFGVICINFFIISTAFLCISFLREFIDERDSFLIVLAMILIILLPINIYFIYKRNCFRKVILICMDPSPHQVASQPSATLPQGESD